MNKNKQVNQEQVSLVRKAASINATLAEKQKRIENALLDYYDCIANFETASYNQSARKFGVKSWQVRDLHNKIQKQLARQEEEIEDNGNE